MDLSALNQLPSVSKRKGRKRVGRGPGSGHGKRSGRGQKGAGSRSGYRDRDFYEGGAVPLVRRFPKRGFNNVCFETRYAVVNLGALECFADGADVTVEALREKGLVRDPRDLVKVLGDGALSRKGLKVTVHRFSKSAKEKLAALGGSATELSPPKPKARTRREFEAYAKAQGKSLAPAKKKQVTEGEE